jgi:hypothetical protein
MIYFLALLPATALTIAGYIVLFLSARAEGSLRTFGRYLGFWAFTLAGLVILGAIFAAAHGGHRGCPFRLHAMHDGMYCPSSDGARPQGWMGPPPAGRPGERSAAPAAPPESAKPL